MYSDTFGHLRKSKTEGSQWLVALGACLRCSERKKAEGVDDFSTSFQIPERRKLKVLGEFRHSSKKA